MLRKLRIAYKIPNVILYISVQRFVKTTGKAATTEAAIACPHLLVGEISKTRRFNQIFGTPDHWGLFWYHIRNELWYLQHPQRAEITADPRSHNPYVIHGDDAPVSRRVGRNIRVLSWYSPFGEGQTLEKKMPCGIIANDQALKQYTEYKVKEAIAWSANAGAIGVHPSAPPPGQTLTKALQAKAGQPITANGTKLAFIGITGDWEFQTNDFTVPWGYSTEEICTKCYAKKSGPHNNFANAHRDADWSKRIRPLSEYIASMTNSEGDLVWNPMCAIRGFHTHGMWEDQVHADMLGVRQHLNGSIIRDLAVEGTWGSMPPRGNWNDKLDTCLIPAYAEFCKWQKLNNQQCTQPMFSSLKLSLHVATDPATLKAKAKNNTVVSRWLLDVVTKQVDPSNELSMQRYCCLWGFVTLFDIPEQIRPRFVFTESEVVELEKARSAALLGFYWLHKKSIECGRYGYNITPKFHQVDEMIRRGLRTRISWHLWWTFCSESAMGNWAKLCGKSHGATIMRRPVERWVMGFWASRFVD